MTAGDKMFCLAPHCASRGYHWPDCRSGDCTGCQPRLAADGLNLCQSHREWLPRDATKAAELHTELAAALAGSGGPDEKTSGTPDRGAKLNPRAVDARHTIRAVLSAWCRLIAEERGIHPPKRRVVKLLSLDFIGPAPMVWTLDDTPQAMAAYLTKHADWLAAHPAAGECADELHDLVTLAHPIAYPTGARVFPVAACPHDGCEGTIKAVLRRVDSLLPSALVCDADETHTWPADQWHTLGKKLRTKEAA